MNVSHFNTLTSFRSESLVSYVRATSTTNKYTTNPMSQKHLEKDTGISPRQQRRYNKHSKNIRTRHNIAVIRRPHRTHIEGLRDNTEGVYFPLGDDIGQVLPNSYEVEVELAAKGMSKKVNSRIRNSLFIKKQRGEKIFYDNQRQAERALRNEENPEAVYVRQGEKARSGAYVWEKQT